MTNITHPSRDTLESNAIALHAALDMAHTLIGLARSLVRLARDAEMTLAPGEEVYVERAEQALTLVDHLIGEAKGSGTAPWIARVNDLDLSERDDCERLDGFVGYASHALHEAAGFRYMDAWESFGASDRALRTLRDIQRHE